MRRTIFAPFVFLTAPARGQWFEGWITLPDSLSGVPGVSSMAYDPPTNTVWVGGRYSDRVLAIQCDSNRCVAAVRIPGVQWVTMMTDNPVNSTVFVATRDPDSLFVIDCATHAVAARLGAAVSCGLFHNPISNKVYYTSSGTPWLRVIDGSTNRVIDSIYLGDWVSRFAFDTRRNWLYCSFTAQRVVIVDCSADSVVADFGTQRHWPGAICYSSRSDKVYCANYIDDTVQVFRRDTVLAEMRVGDYPVDLCYNVRGNKVYSANWSQGNISVIDCSTDHVVRGIATGGNPEVLVYDSLYNRLYCTTGSEVVVIDGNSDVIVDRIPNVRTRDALLLNPRNQTLYYPSSRYGRGVTAANALTGDSIAFIPTMGSERPVTVCYDSATNKVYAACTYDWYGSVVSFDGARNCVLRSISVGARPVALCDDPDRSRVYCANFVAASLSVIDCRTDSVIAGPAVGADPCALLYVAPRAKVYCANHYSRDVSVLDAGTSRRVKNITVGQYPCALAYSAGSDKLYSADSGSGTVSVIDANDSVIRAIAVGAGPVALSYSPPQNVVYCARSYAGGAVVAIDCDTDSVIDTVAVSVTGGIGYDAARDRLYCSRVRWERGYPYIGSVVIDCRTNTVIGEFDHPSSYAQGRIEYGFNDRNNKMYARAPNGSLAVYYACSLMRSFATGGFGGGFAWNTYNNRMYAACQDDSRVVVLRDVGGAGLEEATAPPVLDERRSFLVRAVLCLPASESHHSSFVLLNSAGQRVADLKPGANDVRRLPAGVYFVKQEETRKPRSQGMPNGERRTTSKVVIQR